MTRVMAGLATGLVLLVAGLVSAADKDVALEPIKKVEIGKNREFLVNGKPFFPLMTWLQDPKTYPKLQGMGFNVHCGDADPSAAKAVGCYSVTSFKKEWIGNDHLLGWVQGDEPDMPGKDKKPKHSPEEIVAAYQATKAADPMHPIFMTLTGYFMASEPKYDAATRAKLYPAYMPGCDATGFDVYPIYDSATPGRLLQVADGITALREFAGPRPIYEWIETSKGSKWIKNYSKQIDVEPKDTRAEVWMAIIRGATVIGYFTHAWLPTYTSFRPTPEMQKELTRLNGQITRLAPAILAPPAKAAVAITVADGLKCHCKATQLDNSLYVFAQILDLGPNADKLKQFDPIAPRSGKATITVPGLKAGTAIEVVDENRSLSAADGRFTDDFAPLAEHIYKMKF